MFWLLRRPGFISAAMNPTPRLTKQGLPDLNYYGPKPAKVAAEALTEASGVGTNVVPPASEEVPAAPLPVAE
jgi:hypothetical protein